ncbi:MAG: tRNA (N(6)-L-threonylcarbamoyladenosine(37)-C(2))-methylthiotransferase MtaB [Rhodothalassiaceae bacterium]
MSRPLDIRTFGCRLNAYESEVIRANAGHLTDTVVVNTCAVTAEAVRQARQAIRKARREQPSARILVTGCAAQIDPDQFARMAEVDQVIGNAEKLRPESFAEAAIAAAEPVRVNDIMTVTEQAGHLIDGFTDKARAFVQVQNGCNHRCTFCIIPYGRGNSRSVPMGAVVDQIKRLVDQGYREVVLTGVDLTSYGPDLPGTPTLGRLVQAILKAVPDLPRLRLSSIDSIEVDGPLMDAITGDDRVMPHLHLSLQAGDDLILKRMKRRHLRDDAIAFCEAVRARRPQMVFGADLIAGFPTETEAMFQNSLNLVETCGLTWLHVFPYSEREGTPAAKMPPVAKAVRKQRAARLRAAGVRQVARLLAARAGQRATVLVETCAQDHSLGHTEDFIPVRIDAALPPGTLSPVALAPGPGGVMLGRPGL